VGEIVCSTQTGAMITGGGGFSGRYARPSYQEDAVSGYLAALGRRGLLPSAGMFNRSGRAYPDIAAIGQNVPTVFNGSLAMAGGTSAAAPIVAALFSLLTAERLAAGLPPLGFVNPWLYSTHAAHPEARPAPAAPHPRATHDAPPPSLSRRRSRAAGAVRRARRQHLGGQQVAAQVRRLRPGLRRTAWV
jgi:hypothetical protein